jgi:hypothetical protein
MMIVGFSGLFQYILYKVIENERRFREEFASIAGKRRMKWRFLLIYREKCVKNSGKGL